MHNSTLLFNNVLCIYKVSLGRAHEQDMNMKCKPRCAVA
jgi:hypothetical protein